MTAFSLFNMNETLLHAYTPLILWTGLGLLLFRFMPQSFPRLLGRGLYWVGVPLQVLGLARTTDFSKNSGVAPIATVGALVLGFIVAWLSLQVWKYFATRISNPPREFFSRSTLGSFMLAAMLGNTGFVGLAIAPSLISDSSMSWVVFFSITHNLIAPNGVGVLIASYFGRPLQKNHWWVQVKDVLSVPALWVFAIGFLTRNVPLPEPIESGIEGSLTIVIASAFLLIGMRLAQLQGWKSFKIALFPAILKVVVMPAFVGIVMTLLGFSGEPRLAVVLMSGMPSALLGLILAEEYDLDRELIASSIILTTLLLLIMIPLWILVF